MCGVSEGSSPVSGSVPDVSGVWTVIMERKWGHEELTHGSGGKRRQALQECFQDQLKACSELT